jgi:DNA-binding MurR/RpiR family transcriptional regulator
MQKRLEYTLYAIGRDFEVITLNLIQNMQEAYPSLSKGRKRIVDYILSNKAEAIYLTAAEVAEKVDLSESSVTRFCNHLGYSGYKELQKELRTIILKRPNVLNQFNTYLQEAKSEGVQYMVPVLQDMNNINETFNGMDEQLLEDVVDSIIGARRIGLVALRGSTGPAMIFQLLLNEILDNTYLMTPGIGDYYDKLRTWGEEDVVINFIFFPAKFSYNMMEHAKSKKCKTIAIISSISSEVNEIADLIVPVKITGSTVSFTSVNTLMNVLLYLIGMRLEDRMTGSLTESEKILDMLCE